jgi:hypothetical protein
MKPLSLKQPWQNLSFRNKDKEKRKLNTNYRANIYSRIKKSDTAMKQFVLTNFRAFYRREVES